jgi:hypothetical protein
LVNFGTGGSGGGSPCKNPRFGNPEAGVSQKERRFFLAVLGYGKPIPPASPQNGQICPKFALRIAYLGGLQHQGKLARDGARVLPPVEGGKQADGQSTVAGWA